MDVQDRGSDPPLGDGGSHRSYSSLPASLKVLIIQTRQDVPGERSVKNIPGVRILGEERFEH